MSSATDRIKAAKELLNRPVPTGPQVPQAVQAPAAPAGGVTFIRRSVHEEELTQARQEVEQQFSGQIAAAEAAKATAEASAAEANRQLTAKAQEVANLQQQLAARPAVTVRAVLPRELTLETVIPVECQLEAIARGLGLRADLNATNTLIVWLGRVTNPIRWREFLNGWVTAELIERVQARRVQPQPDPEVLEAEARRIVEASINGGDTIDTRHMRGEIRETVNRIAPTRRRERDVEGGQPNPPTDDETRVRQAVASLFQNCAPEQVSSTLVTTLITSGVLIGDEADLRDRCEAQLFGDGTNGGLNEAYCMAVAQALRITEPIDSLEENRARALMAVAFDYLITQFLPLDQITSERAGQDFTAATARLQQINVASA